MNKKKIELKYFEQDKQETIREKKLYFDLFLDMYNSEIISYCISEKTNALATMEALKEAIDMMQDCPFHRIFHSDQRCVYQIKTYRQKLKERNIFQSMSRKGNRLDNSLIENFFSLLNTEKCTTVFKN